MSKRKIYKTNPVRKYIILSLFLFFFIGIGYSLFSSDLFISGSISVDKYDQTLYGVLEKAAKQGTYAREYTGEHQDSMNSSLSTEKIYYWYAENDTDANAILNKNNVEFAGFCWQMIRTTDTGGVKLLYNGESENTQCLTSRGTHVGYSARTTQNLDSNYYYGTNFIYDSTANNFRLSDSIEQSTWSSSIAPNLIGKYTCRQTSANATCTTLYLVESYADSSNGNVIPISKNSHYSQIGQLQFNANNDSPAYAGYMYNIIFNYNTSYEDMHFPYQDASSFVKNNGMWYSDSVSYSNGKYSLVNPQQVDANTTNESLIGKYTFGRTTQNYTNTSVSYLTDYEQHYDYKYYYYFISVLSGKTYLDYIHTYTYGDTYHSNNNDTYTIENPTTFNTLEYRNNLNNLKNKYICIDAQNSTCSELLHAKNTIDKRGFSKSSSLVKYKFSSSFTYNSTTGMYTLDDNNSVSIWDKAITQSINNYNTHHYTCFNETGVCSELKYVYKYDADKLYYYYISLTNGNSINTALDSMLYNSNVNTNSSIIKTGIEAWYEKYLSIYDSYMEDVIYCNDRSTSELNGWNPNNGSVTNNLIFTGNSSSNYNLNCTNQRDRLSTSNNQAKLKYSVGLLTTPEVNLLNSATIRKASNSYWLMSPGSFSQTDMNNKSINTSGGITSTDTNTAGGVRPVISLSPNVKYSSGIGTTDNPYVIAIMD